MRFSSKTSKNKNRRRRSHDSRSERGDSRSERGKRLGPWVIAGVLSLTAPATAEEARILSDLQAYFATDDASTRQHLADGIAAQPSFDPALLSGYLHRLDLWEKLKPGRHELQVAVGYDHARRITLRLPRGYTPTKAWPLLYAMHPSGGTGPSYIGRVEALLGEKIEQYVVAAPTHYRQTILDAPPPFTPEHPVILRELRRRLHLDADRTYVMGYSTGGYTSWTLAALHADQFGGAVPMASAYSFPADVEGLWRAMTPNFAEVPILHIWGANDSLAVPGFEMRDPKVGTISQLNRQFSPMVRELGLDVVDHRVMGAGHGGLRVPKGELARVLTHERPHYPQQVEHRFRHIHQARAYWLEGHEWVGDHWGKPGRKIDRKKDESPEEAMGRTVLPLLGLLQGKVDGQTLRVRRRHVGDLTVWLSDSMVDFKQDVTVVVNGKTAFTGKVKPDLGVCLSEAARTYDFERLRWAGLWIDKDSTARPMTVATEIPPLIRVP